MTNVVPNPLADTTGAFRFGTLLADKDTIVAVLGAPQWELKTERTFDKYYGEIEKYTMICASHSAVEPRIDNKVTMSWVFDTPSGPAVLRDYWWNGPGEWSIAARNKESFQWFIDFLKSKGFTGAWT